MAGHEGTAALVRILGAFWLRGEPASRSNLALTNVS